MVDPMVYVIGMASLFGFLLFIILGNIFWPAKLGEKESFFPEDDYPGDGKISAKL